MPTPNVTFRLLAGGCAAALVATLGACEPGRRGLPEAADRLAAVMVALDGVPAADAGAGSAPGEDAPEGPLTAADREALAPVVAGMAGADATVRVLEVEELDRDAAPSPPPGDGDAATVTLQWTWDLDSGPWAYETTALLVDEDAGWRAVPEPAVIHADLRAGERLARSVVPPHRGDVLGAGGRLLVTERDVYRVGIDKGRLPEGADPAAAGAQLAAWAGLEDPPAFGARVAAGGARQFVEAIVVRAEEFPLSSEPLEAIPGAVALSGRRPLAPTAGFARPLLGRVGEATAEIVEESGGAVRPGALTGLSGLQRRYEQRLAGTAGERIEARADGGSARVLHEVAARDGEPLHLTLDLGLQTLAEDVLADVGPASALVAVRASTGEVVAAASGPGSLGQNTATEALPVPGSTFKVATALALLRAGLEPDTPVPCTDTLTIDGRRFANNPDYPPTALGDITLRAAIANSCNTALLAQRDLVSGQDVARAAEALGLGTTAGGAADPGFPYAGASVPADQQGLEHAASLIGQGRDLASPLAAAASIASVVAGHRVDPVLVRDTATSAPASEPLTATEAEALRAMLRAVVTEGSATFLADVPGPPVLAKSGTGQYGTDDPPTTNAWMIAAQGDLAVSVYVAEGVYGTVTAGPLLEEFLRAVPGSATDSTW